MDINPSKYVCDFIQLIVEFVLKKGLVNYISNLETDLQMKALVHPLIKLIKESQT